MNVKVKIIESTTELGLTVSISIPHSTLMQFVVNTLYCYSLLQLDWDFLSGINWAVNTTVLHGCSIFHLHRRTFDQCWFQKDMENDFRHVILIFVLRTID